MIIDTLDKADMYAGLHKHFATAFQYLRSTDFSVTDPGRHVLIPNELFAILSEYDTKSEKGEQMESHQKHIDIQYIVSGTERMGIALKADQGVSTPYSEETDFMLYEDDPEFFIKVNAGSFVIFYPDDLHMPTIQTDLPARVRKVVMKVRIN